MRYGKQSLCLAASLLLWNHCGLADAADQKKAVSNARVSNELKVSSKGKQAAATGKSAGTKKPAPKWPKTSAADAAAEKKVEASIAKMTAKDAIKQGKALAGQKKYKESIPYFSHAMKADPKSGEAVMARAESKRQLEHWDEACDDYFRYTQLYPTDSDGYLNLGQAFHKMGKDQQALFYLNRAVVLSIKNPFIYVQRALVYDALGKKAEAAADRDLAKKLGFDGSDDTK